MRNIQGLKILGLTILIMLSFSVGRFSAFLGDSPSPSHQGAGANSSSLNQISPALTYTVTAYCPESCCCGEWADGRTASGIPAVGKIVAAPPNIPYGTRLLIPGYGEAVVQDRGGAIVGNRLDVLFPTHQEALNWGVQELEVTFMEMD